MVDEEGSHQACNLSNVTVITQGGICNFFKFAFF